MSKLYATKALKEWRENKGYTQAEMVSLFNIESGNEFAFVTYQKWEQGQLNLTPDNALELSRFTKIELKDLVTRK